MVSLPAHSLAAVSRVFSTPAASVNSFSSWAGVSAAFMPPVARTELPPTMAWLSTMTTFLPASAAVMAAVMPAPPAPTMTMSVSTARSSAAAASPLPVKSAASRPAAARAAARASLTALEVMVAPETTSMAPLLPETISSGAFSTITEPMPSVSLSPTISQPVMTPSVRVMVTDTSPMPVAVPVNSPDTPPAASPEPAEAAVEEELPPPQAVRPKAMTAASASAAMRFLMMFLPFFVTWLPGAATPVGRAYLYSVYRIVICLSRYIFLLILFCIF